MLISLFDLERIVHGDGWSVLDLVAGLIGAEPPSRILADIRSADPDSARGVVTTWRTMKAHLDEHVRAIDLDLAVLSAGWSGRAAQTAVTYLRRLTSEVTAIASVA